MINKVDQQEITPFLKVAYVCNNVENNENNVSICISELSNLLTIQENISVYFENTDLMFSVYDTLNVFKCIRINNYDLDFNVLTVFIKW